MTNLANMERLKEGAESWNQWRHDHPDIDPDLRKAMLEGLDLAGFELGRANLREACLSKAILSGASLVEADLTDAKLCGATLKKAFLAGADLHRADLYGADLTGASLECADFSEANLRTADLRRADLWVARFTGANLSGALIDHARLGYTVFGSNDLSEVKELDDVVHSHPSIIGIDTIYRSQGHIPERFLRGCGVPETFITQMKSLVASASPIEFYSCFISYSTKDQDFADRLYADLQNKGVRCWFAPHDIQGGKKLHEQIDEAIRLHDKLLLILSPHSMQSEWVNTEIAKARKRELRDQRRVLFPIRLAPFETLRDWECFDADTGKDSAREIREYFIPDFSHWKNHDSYQEAFHRLLTDLKASDAKPK